MKEEPRNRFTLPNVFNPDNEYRKINNNITGSFMNLADKRSPNNINSNNINMNQGKSEYKEKEIYSNEAIERKGTYNFSNQFSNRVTLN